MTLVDLAGNPIGDLPPRNVGVDMNAIAQRIGIARQHPMESQRTAAKNLLVEDATILFNIAHAQHAQIEALTAQHQGLLGNAQTSNVLLALILAQEPEWRWSKEFVEAFEPSGSWELLPDPAAPEHRWLLRMGPPTRTVSAEEQTDVARETDSPELPGDGSANFIGGAGLRIVRDQHVG